ncbi:MAG: glycine cleavage system aminomethyltransferase GcvT [Prevotella bivia]|uniref:Aminomethyltransferase n=3 Tax=Prevotella bivia TaxID=28125 RepID=I4ZBW5_9BACT|nr:glycine cleavage system aminomethyltransferase GcvT [Prevotella bivia]EFB92202.1 aminomethyltransferase [Prevotella bivia JCVIHMP010]EIM33707.1 glycine cleavage system T protein [Prevotella bivia DSM 20514]KGF23075.1 glycine cleavage system protein T [Prevotella bivia DNF00188]KGF38434.1 glycine cleavage system protein T [Prevotella bivia DNF00650]KGF45045.1 glycine cleavage system protein T [Prevotella bivia DNF00320]
MENKRTCLYDKHIALGALMSPFAGFDMPIQYSSITEEHNAVREHCGVFDVSHMGESYVEGPDAERFVNNIFTNDVTNAPLGQVYYGMMCHPNGGTVDDLLVYKMGEEKFFLVYNAGNIDKDVAWIDAHKEGFDIKIEHASSRYGQLAVQGPEAEAVVDEVLGLPCKELKFYTAMFVNVDGAELVLSRTGYTGEDGFEIYGPHAYILAAWDKLLASGKCKPCGLGCRDTLRFEVGLPLYGDELTDEISPVMAGLSMFCKLGEDKPDFIGKTALVDQKANGVAKRLRGIELEGNAIPRHGYKVLKDGVEVGEITTGYRLLSVDKSCAVALVDDAVKMGDTVEVQIRKKTFPGTVVKKKFYDKHYKK